MSIVVGINAKQKNTMQRKSSHRAILPVRKRQN